MLQTCIRLPDKARESAVTLKVGGVAIVELWTEEVVKLKLRQEPLLYTQMVAPAAPSLHCSILRASRRTHQSLPSSSRVLENWKLLYEIG